MKYLLFLVVLWGSVSDGQVITTFAGNGSLNNLGDGGQATNAGIYYPTAQVIDKNGNIYVSEGTTGNRVRLIRTDGIISLFAGTGVAGFSGDGGPAIDCQFNNIQDLALDTIGNLYIADHENNRIRKVDIHSGIVSTYAGTGVGAYGGDGGQATSAMIYSPLDLCFDKKGNLFIADNGNVRVRKVNPSGIISTVIGTGFPFNSPGGGLGDTTPIVAAGGLCFDLHDNLILSDWHARVYKLDTFGYISTIIGNGTSGNSGDGGLAINAEIIPAKVSCDRFGNIIISDYDQDRIRIVNKLGIISSLTGTGITGYSGDGGLAINANINHPDKITIDSCGNILFSDTRNHRIRKITYPKCNYLSVEDTHPNNPISIHPNPTTSTLQIDNLKSTTQYHLCNMVGTILMQGTLKPGNNSLPIDTIEQGIYMLVLIDEEGEKTVQKIVKE